MFVLNAHPPSVQLKEYGIRELPVDNLYTMAVLTGGGFVKGFSH
jgi:hypothetical protein